MGNAVLEKKTLSMGLKEVLDNDLCIACGACVFCDDSLSLSLNPDKMMYEPNGPGNELAASVCPAIEVDYHAHIEKLYPGEEIGPLGVVKTAWLAQSTDYDRNLKSSSGGLIKEVTRALLRRDDVDGVIGLRKKSGLLYEPALLTSEDEVDTLPGSIYHSVPFDNALRILREHEGRFVLIVNPCQLEGIYNYIFKVEPHLKERIYMTIGLVCGWTFTHHSLQAICDFKGVDFSKIEDVSYRGGGPVGKLHVITDESELRVNRRVDFDYQVAFDRSFNVPRCHLCINHTNVLADLVVADAWLPSTVRTKTGISLLLTRREECDELLRSLVDEKRLVLSEVSQEDMVESQTRNVAYGDFSYSYADYRRSQGLFTPTLIGPNRDAAKSLPVEPIDKFHTNLVQKRALQQERKFRELRRRKILKEWRPFAARYIRWFFVRVLKIKSLLGIRKEVDSSALKDFR